MLSPNTEVAPWSRPTKYSTTNARNAVRDSHIAAFASERSTAGATVLRASGEIMSFPFRDIASRFQGRRRASGLTVHSGATVLDSHQDSFARRLQQHPNRPRSPPAPYPNCWGGVLRRVHTSTS